MSDDVTQGEPLLSVSSRLKDLKYTSPRGLTGRQSSATPGVKWQGLFLQK